MNAKHRFTVHAQCPYEPVTDYYRVTFATSDFVKVEELREAILAVAGQCATQEALTQQLANLANCTCWTKGMHGTTHTEIMCLPEL